MARRKRRHQRAPKRDQKMEDIPMTPMIDVVFQLLIYFVFTFEIPDRIAQIPVFRPAAPPEPTPIRPPQNIRVGVYENFYTINDRRMTPESMTRTFNQLANLDSTQNVIVLATGNSKHGSLVFVLDLLHKSGLEKVSLMSAD